MSAAKHTPGQLGDPGAEQFYLELIASPEARAQWSDPLVPKSDAAKRKLAEKCLLVVRNFTRNRIAKATGSAS